MARRLTDTLAGWRQLALLAAAVLAVHLWLLQGMPGVVRPHAPPPAWHARTIARAPSPEVSGGPLAALPPSRPLRERAPPSLLQGPSPPRAASVSRRTSPISEAAAATVAAKPAIAPTRAPATQAGAFAVPPPVRLHYEVTAHTRGVTLKGQARLDWHHDGRRYEALLEVSSPLVRTRTQRSEGLIDEHGLAPLRFSDKRRSEEATHFDRVGGKVIFSSNQPQAPLEVGAQDRLSVMLQLAAMIAAEPARYPAGTAISMQTASTREAERWTFTVEGTEQLRLPAGSVPALKLTRNPRKEYDVKVELWLAPGQAYVPVRLRLTQPGGDWVDQQWSSTDRE